MQAPSCKFKHDLFGMLAQQGRCPPDADIAGGHTHRIAKNLHRACRGMVDSLYHFLHSRVREHLLKIAHRREEGACGFETLALGI
jgi:hypothetical protein